LLSGVIVAVNAAAALAGAGSRLVAGGGRGVEDGSFDAEGFFVD